MINMFIHKIRKEDRRIILISSYTSTRLSWAVHKKSPDMVPGWRTQRASSFFPYLLSKHVNNLHILSAFLFLVPLPRFTLHHWINISNLW